MTRITEGLRKSDYHQQFGRKLCAAFIAQQQGIALATALKKVPEPVADVWLEVAEFARRAAMQNIDQNFTGAMRQHSDMIV